jgi:hypothetical protein
MFDFSRLGDGAFCIRRCAAGAFVAFAMVDGNLWISSWQALDFFRANVVTRSYVRIRCHVGVHADNAI